MVGIATLTVTIAVECQADRIQMRLDTGYLDRRADTLDEALAIIDDAVAGKRLLSYREGVVATVSTWQIILQGFDPRTCWEVLSLQVNGKSDASSAAAFRRPAAGRCSTTSRTRRIGGA